MNALRVGFAALIALLVLQLAWHGWFDAQRHWSMLMLTSLPLLVAIWIGLHNRRRGVLVGGMLCLLYFSHGIESLWSEPSSRWLASIEIVLSLILIGALGWDARAYRRRK